MTKFGTISFLIFFATFALGTTFLLELFSFLTVFFIIYQIYNFVFLNSMRFSLTVNSKTIKTSTCT